MSDRRGGACDACLARAWLLQRLAGHLDNVGGRVADALCLGDEQLILALGGRASEAIRRELEEFDPQAARTRAATAQLGLICRCDPAFPRRLRDLRPPPATLHVAGRLERFLTLAADDPIALVGARRASPYGLEVARALGRDLARAGVPIVSGLALGIDSAAHAGALGAAGGTIAVLAGAAERPYPASKAGLHRDIRGSGSVISELPPGTDPRRWMFPARNRIVAGLCSMTVVVEAGERSGALLTAAIAADLGRRVGAVPGRITAPGAVGCHRLIAHGADLIAGAQDILDHAFGPGARSARPGREVAALEPPLRALLEALGAGHDTAQAFTRAGLSTDEGLAALAELELGGYLHREPGGRFALSA